MEFDKTKVFSFYDRNKVKIGSTGYFANKIYALADEVANETGLEELKSTNASVFNCFADEDGDTFEFFYLVEEPSEHNVLMEKVHSYWKEHRTEIYKNVNNNSESMIISMNMERSEDDLQWDVQIGSNLYQVEEFVKEFVKENGEKIV